MGFVVDSGDVVSRAAPTFDRFGCLMLPVVWFGRSRAHQVDEDHPCGASQRRNHSTADPSAKVHIVSLSVQSGLFSVHASRCALAFRTACPCEVGAARGELRRPWCGQCEATGSLTVLFGLLS